MYTRLVLLFCLLFVSVNGTPSGAGQDACINSSMDPSGHGDSVANVPSPYGLTVSSEEYRPSGTLTVTLSGGDSFKGFLIMALPENVPMAAPVGSFTASNFIQDHCTGGATHTAAFSTNADQNAIELTWTAPEETAGNILFYATVVQMKTMYWVKQPSSLVLPANVTMPIVEPTDESTNTSITNTSTTAAPITKPTTTSITKPSTTAAPIKKKKQPIDFTSAAVRSDGLPFALVGVVSWTILSLWYH